MSDLTPEIEDALQTLTDVAATTPGYPSADVIRQTLEALADRDLVVINFPRGPRAPSLLREYADRIEEIEAAQAAEAAAEETYGSGSVPGSEEAREESPEEEPDPPLAPIDVAAPRGAHVPQAGMGDLQPKVRERKRPDDLGEEELVIEQPKQRE